MPEKKRPVRTPHSSSNGSGGVSLVKGLDYRLLLLGALLPDLLDKLVGQVLFVHTFSSGRIIGHTLLFAALLLAFGVGLRIQRRSAGLMWFFFGWLVHLCLDEMWAMPQTFFWPLYGWSFERLDLSNWGQDMVTALLTKPDVFVPEIVGTLILGAFLVKLLRSGQLRIFFRTGLVV